MKPQFEAGPTGSGEAAWCATPTSGCACLDRWSAAAADAGFAPQGVMASPVAGPAGNVEFLLWARRDGVAVPVDLERAVAEAREVAA